ncbi:MAG: HAD family phosphatase [Anaerolineales bacterium]|nr:HAD family phosphatase [Anaerolineales bacterium]
MGKNNSAIRISPEEGPQIPVFDFGGVLFDWDPRHLFRHFFDGDTEAMERFLAEIDFFGWNAAMDQGQPFAEAVRERCARFPHYAEWIRAFDTRWEETVRGPIPGMADLLSRLRQAAIPQYGLSNTSAEKYRVLRQKYPFLRLLAGVLISGEAGICKPDPRIFELFLERTGLQKETLLFIDDSPANITAAQTLGWSAVRFTSAQELEKELIGRKFL